MKFLRYLQSDMKQGHVVPSFIVSLFLHAAFIALFFNTVYFMAPKIASVMKVKLFYALEDHVELQADPSVMLLEESFPQREEEQVPTKEELQKTEQNNPFMEKAISEVTQTLSDATEKQQRPEVVTETSGMQENSKPLYPKIAQRMGWQGEVLLKAHVSKTGMVTGVEVLKGSGYDVLDRNAVDTIFMWKFNPARMGGVAIASEIKIPVQFHLNTSE